MKTESTPSIATPLDGDRLLTSHQVAELVQVREQSVRRWRLLGVGPSYLRLNGGHIRYPESGVHKWLASGLVVTGSSK